jgi:hypothetical protein
MHLQEAKIPPATSIGPFLHIIALLVRNSEAKPPIGRDPPPPPRPPVPMSPSRHRLHRWLPIELFRGIQFHEELDAHPQPPIGMKSRNHPSPPRSPAQGSTHPRCIKPRCQLQKEGERLERRAQPSP